MAGAFQNSAFQNSAFQTDGGTVVSTNTPGWKRIGMPGQFNGETEEEKLARRVLEGTIQVPVIPIPADDVYSKESKKLVAAIAKFRVDAEASRKAIERIEQAQVKRQTAKLQRDLLRAQQALQLAMVQEQAMMEELEVLDIVFLAQFALRVTLQ